MRRRTQINWKKNKATCARCTLVRGALLHVAHSLKTILLCGAHASHNCVSPHYWPSGNNLIKGNQKSRLHCHDVWVEESVRIKNSQVVVPSHLSLELGLKGENGSNMLHPIIG
ncbi:hypothetical protein L345_01691, partial [Ophiophagus hannah]